MQARGCVCLCVHRVEATAGWRGRHAGRGGARGLMLPQPPSSCLLPWRPAQVDIGYGGLNLENPPQPNVLYYYGARGARCVLGVEEVGRSLGGTAHKNLAAGGAAAPLKECTAPHTLHTFTMTCPQPPSPAPSQRARTTTAARSPPARPLSFLIQTPSFWSWERSCSGTFWTSTSTPWCVLG